ncbi:MAG: MFS transporter, partial [Bacteroidota bacterium]
LTAFTGAAFSYGSLLIIRLLFGAGEAGAFPGMSRAVFSWFPLRERGLVLGLNFSGSRLGAAFALPLVAWLIESYGWRMSFYILGGVGVVWAILWWLAFRDRPEEHQAVSEKEKEYILANRQQSDDKEQLASIPIGQLLQSSNMLSAIGQYFASNFTFFFALSWLFPFLKEQYNLEAVEAGWASVAPFIFGALGNWLGGIWMDSLFQNSTWRRSRILPAITGFGMAALGMMGSVYADNLWLAVAFLSIAIMGADMTLPTSWALCVDIGKEQSGRVSGLMNMAGNVGAFLTALAFPYLKDWTGSMDVFFYTAAGLNLLAIWLWTRVEPAKGLES